jgi:hypothetical protein
MIAHMATDLSAAGFLTFHATLLKNRKQRFSRKASMARGAHRRSVHETHSRIKTNSKRMRGAGMTGIDLQGQPEVPRTTVFGNVLS